MRMRTKWPLVETSTIFIFPMVLAVGVLGLQGVTTGLEGGNLLHTPLRFSSLIMLLKKSLPWPDLQLVRDAGSGGGFVQSFGGSPLQHTGTIQWSCLNLGISVGGQGFG